MPVGEISNRRTDLSIAPALMRLERDNGCLFELVGLRVNWL